MNQRPNIILITVHDLGRHLQCYDPDLPATPAICSIAQDGILFENHFSTSPLCSPARASIQTGKYPHCNGMNGLTHRGFSLHKSEKCISHYLNDIGYETALYGHQHETDSDMGCLGYKEICTKPKYPETCMEIMPHVKNFLKRERKNPFFLSLGFFEVHRSFKEQQRLQIDASDIKVPVYLPDCPAVREDLADFYGLIKKVDTAIAQLIDILSHAGLEKNTLLVFTTDHGAAFPRAKSTLYDTGIGVAFLARWSGVIKSGTKIHQLTSHIDVLLTILEITGFVCPDALQGQSFLAAMRGDESTHRECIYGEKSWHGNEYDPMRGIRTNKWKYILNFTKGFSYQMPLDIKMSLSGQAVECQRRTTLRPSAELYNIENDIHEINNLIDDDSYVEIQKKMNNKLKGWMIETADPLLKGDIRWPQTNQVHYMNNMDHPMPKRLE